MRKEIIAIGILAMIAVCATLAMAAQDKVLEIEMTPDTLNLDSNGKFITAFIDVDDLDGINPMELYLTDDLDNSGSEINMVPALTAVDYVTYWAVKFPRAQVLDWLGGVDVTTGTIFETDLYVKHITNEEVDFIATDEFVVLKTKKSIK